MKPLAGILLILLAGMACFRFQAAHVRDSFENREQARLRVHFARVLVRLEMRDVSALAPAPRLARRRALTALRRYAAAGVFPRNRGAAAVATPIFVDHGGRRCAMAFLMEDSGLGALVERIASHANLARIRELSGDPELDNWLCGAGLSLEEAAAIQPQYHPPTDEDSVPSDGVMTSATVMAFTCGLPAVFLNMQVDKDWATRKQHGVFGIVTAVSLLAAGMTDAFHDGALRGTGFITLSVGSAAAILSVRNLSSGPRSNAASMAATTPIKDRATMQALLRRGTSGEAQLGVHVSF